MTKDSDNTPDRDQSDSAPRRTGLTPEERRLFALECIEQHNERRRLTSMLWAWLFGGNEDKTH
jgi:hypothetical protein